MHGLDPGTDLSFLQGKQLTQLALGCREFQLKLYAGFKYLNSIYVLCSERGAESLPVDCDPYRAKELYILLGKTIEGWTIGANGELALLFADECLLTILDSNKSFES